MCIKYEHMHDIIIICIIVRVIIATQIKLKGLSV